MTDRPKLSVVVALISGNKDDLKRCLEALDAAKVTFPVEVVVPWDTAVKEVTTLAAEFADVNFVRSEGTRTIRKIDGRVREHHDSLRTTGIRHARGEVVALTEDHAHVSENWCAEMIAAIERYPNAAAIGGAVDCDSDYALGWAVWFCDFGRYQSPVPEGPVAFVSDANVGYRRDRLEQVGVFDQYDYHETIVHGRMQQRGLDLVSTPGVLVWQARGRLPWLGALRERFTWGRSYAGGRAHEMTLGKRVLYALLSPGLPPPMTWRLWRHAKARGRSNRFLGVLPAVLLLQGMWAIGEFVGYITGRP